MKIVIIDWQLHSIKEIETDEVQYKEDGLYYRYKHSNITGLQKVNYGDLLDVYFLEDYKIAETGLKAFEIIRSKNVNMFLLKASFGEVFGFEMYNRNANDLLTREEYDLLKEVLL